MMRLRVVLDRLDLVAAEISDDLWNPEVLVQTCGVGRMWPASVARVASHTERPDNH